MMGFSRRNHRRAAWAALFALLLQFALSFGHIHTEDFFPSSPSGDAAVADRHVTPGAPTGQIPEGLGHDACAICAVMHLAGSLILPEPIRLDIPRIAGDTPAPLGHVLVLASAPHLLFQTRAPPVI